MFKTRLISGIFLVIAAILTIRAGGYVLCATLMALSVIGIWELYRACGIAGKDPLPVTGAAAAFLWYVLLVLPAERFHMLFIAGVLIAVMTVYVLTYPRYNAEQVMAAVFGFLYVPVLLSCIFLTRMTHNGHITVWLVFLSAWGADTCAYSVGMLIGKHKMAPVLSPKKSIEGGVGGVVGAVLLGVIYALIMHQPALEYGVICFFGALLSMVGDLAASAIKRNRGIKDYGKLIPGHGGVLDRFDSILFTAPVIYFLSLILLVR
ncbi:MAG: phosphatidate cytidylyltransferase [Lachnospiraceae bacterium]|nr:phosphatidate cytidylyltransferase [Lachnospiraceae bacterium]